MSLPVIIIGNGGHASVVLSTLRAAGRHVIAATDLMEGRQGRIPTDIPIITDSQLMERFPSHSVELALGLGSIWPCEVGGIRIQLAQKFESKGYRFPCLVHPFSSVALGVDLPDGCQVFAGVVVQPGVTIGRFTILNSCVSVDHDCAIGSFCHLSPRATLSGDVVVGDMCHLGTGCAVIQSVRLGNGCFVAAGATVVASYPGDLYLRGTPAKPFIPFKERVE